MSAVLLLALAMAGGWFVPGDSVFVPCYASIRIRVLGDDCQHPLLVQIVPPRAPDAPDLRDAGPWWAERWSQ